MTLKSADDFRFLRYPEPRKPKTLPAMLLSLRLMALGGKARLHEPPANFEGSTFFQSGWNEETEKGTVCKLFESRKLLPAGGLPL